MNYCGWGKGNLVWRWWKDFVEDGFGEYEVRLKGIFFGTVSQLVVVNYLIETIPIESFPSLILRSTAQ
jgi:hypothetical protein